MMNRLAKGFIVICLGFVLGCGGMMQKTSSLLKRPFGEKGSSDVQKPDTERMNKGERLFLAGDFKGALNEFKANVTADPDSPQAHYNLGLASYELGMYQEAVNAYVKAIQLKPDFGEAHFNLGVVYDRSGQPDKALQEYRLAMRHGIDDAAVHFNMGLSLMKLSRMEEARKEYLRALELDQTMAEAYNNLGYLAEETGDVDTAVAMYKKALAVRPDYPMARENMERLVKVTPAPAPERPTVAGKGIKEKLSLELDAAAGLARDVEMDIPSGTVDIGSQYKRAIFRLGYTPGERFRLFLDLGVTDLGFDDTINFGAVSVDFKRVLGFAYGAGVNAMIHRWDERDLLFDASLSFLMGSNKDEYQNGVQATADWTELNLSLAARYLGYPKLVPYGGLSFTQVDATFELDLVGSRLENDYSEANPVGVFLGASYPFMNILHLQAEARFLHETALVFRASYQF